MTNLRQQSQERNPEIPQQVAALMVPHLSEAEWREATLTIVTQEVDDMWREIKEFLDNDFAPGVTLKPAALRKKFLFLLATDNQGDMGAAAVEFDFLMRPDYLDLIRAGLAPPPVSRPWAQLLVAPVIFRWVQARFREVMQRQLRELNASAT